MSELSTVDGNNSPSPKHLKAALSYAARGWAVFPLAPGSKVPPKGTHGHLGATTDPARIRAWWERHPRDNIGIATGTVSGLLVIDLDTKTGGPANFKAMQAEHGGCPATVVGVTGSGGNHIIFALPEGISIGCSSNKVAAGVDVRCDGGYIAAPPSIHPNGLRYRWFEGYGPDEMALAHPPPWVLQACRDASAASRVAGGTVSPETWRDLFAGGASVGERDAIATRLFGYLVKKHDPLLAFDILKLWNRDRCRPPLADTELTKIADSLARRELKKLGGPSHAG